MSTRASRTSSARYQTEATLGQGGMATVYRALDRETATAVALKRLRTDGRNSGSSIAIELFEREYLTLAQLSHPRMVEVFDYGVDEQGPYYTMELLDGGDLQGLAPLPWARACALAADVCSALALLHSRRMVYRDLSPRNVRCTSDGAAKLIDFGAMAPFGPSRELVGTAPCVAPEALNLQALDARTDLYALGATLYFAITQRHAYPAREIAQLRDVWRSRPRRPAEVVPELPPALDQLVMDLLQFDVTLRPASAAEVLERLSAITGGRRSEQAVVAQSYLSSPSLVGRREELSRLRKCTLNTLQRRGGTLLITGAAGIGRSRLLDACVLEAKLAGLIVVRVDAQVAEERAEYAVARSIARQLLEAARPFALAAAEEHAPLLGSVMPELVGTLATLATDAENEEQKSLGAPRVLQAFESFLIAFAQRKPLLLAVDDFQALDERSAGLLGVLSERAPGSGMLLAVTAPLGVAPPALRPALQLLERRSHKFALEALSRERVEELLTSVFGAVPNLAALASYLHDVARGNPRDTMQLVQHLVAQEVIAYAGGSWSLPDRIRLQDLPASFHDALAERAQKLAPEARRLALSFALEPGLRFSFDDCVALAAPREPLAVFETLQSLVLDDVSLPTGTRYGLSQGAWSEPLLAAATEAERARAHACLAELLHRRGDDLRAASHLFMCGERERALDLLLEHVERTTIATERDASEFFAILRDLPPDWLRAYERGLETCRELDRPAREADLLLSRLVGLIAHAISDTCAYHHIQGRLDRLSAACGLDLFASISSGDGEAARMKAAFLAANERFEALPERARSYAPSVAVKQLAQSTLSAVGVIAYTHDYEAIRRLPLLAPLASLFPAIGVARDLVEGVVARIGGRNERAIELYDALLRGPFAAAPAHDLSRSHQTATRLRLTLSAATLEAAMGLTRCIERVREVEAEPTFAAQAMLARQLFFVWQGALTEADHCKRQAEVLQIHSSSHHGFEGQHLFSELCAYALMDDLTRVKRSAEALEGRVALHAAWRPILHYAQGEFQRIRGDLGAARVELESALALGRAGEQPLWAQLAGSHVRVLVELGEHALAAELGEAYLREAERAELGYTGAYVAMPLSLALGHLGRHDEAVRHADAAIATFAALGASGLNVALSYETRARIALLAGTRQEFELARRKATAAWGGSAKRLAKALSGQVRRPSMEEADDERALLSDLVSKLDACSSAVLRARCGLEHLVTASGASGGLLYACVGDSLRHLASSEELQRSEVHDALAAAYWKEQLEQDATTDTEDLADTASLSADEVSNGELRPILLMHQEQGELRITGVALLLVGAEAAYEHPGRIAGELSRYLAGRGDVEPFTSA